MKKVLITLALAAGVVSGVTAPADAGTNNVVTHAADDTGYNDPMRIFCNDGTYRWLGLGAASNDPGKCPNGVWEIRPLYGYYVRCYDTVLGWSNSPLESRAWYVPNNVRLKCYQMVSN